MSVAVEIYQLKRFFEENPVVALCFSGGVDSTYLLYTGLHYGANISAYYVKSEFQPEFELKEALKIAKQLKIELNVLTTSVLTIPQIENNFNNRCLHCVNARISLIKMHASKDGFHMIIDGTNASDEFAGCSVKTNLCDILVRSPLKEAGLRKSKIRFLSKKVGLVTWDKPSYTCLATRIPTGTPIVIDILDKIERAEKVLSVMGFTNFSINTSGSIAKLQVSASEMENVIAQRERIVESLKPEFDSILLDLITSN